MAKDTEEMLPPYGYGVTPRGAATEDTGDISAVEKKKKEKKKLQDALSSFSPTQMNSYNYFRKKGLAPMKAVNKVLKQVSE